MEETSVTLDFKVNLITMALLMRAATVWSFVCTNPLGRFGLGHKGECPATDRLEAEATAPPSLVVALA